MKSILYLAAILPLAFATTAFADDTAAATGSVYEHQTDSGKFEVTPGLTFGSIKTNFSSTYSPSVTSATDSVFDFFVGGEYGINDMWSVGLRLGYASDNLSFSPAGGKNFSASGMADPDLYVNGRTMVGSGSLRFGTHLTTALGNYVIASSGNSANEYSGGFTLTPFVGYEMMAGPGNLGVRLTYDLYQSNRNITNNQSTFNGTLKGGNNLGLTVFYEMNFQPVIWGVDVGVDNHASTTDTVNSVSETNHDAYTWFKVETYAAWEVAHDINILPTIGYGTIGNATEMAAGGQLQGANGSGGIYGTIAARFGF